MIISRFTRWLLSSIAQCMAGAGLLMAPAAFAVGANVSIVDFAFSPAAVTIQANDSVTWTWAGSASHSTTSDTAGLWDSGIMSHGATFAHTFTSAGSFPYHCTVHPFMTASVTVQGQPPTNIPPTISITAPANGSVFAAPWTGTIQVTDSDSDGSVSKIQFFAGTTLLGTLNSPAANASLTVTNLAAGSYTLTAVATDNGGASTTSAGIHISVQTPTNIPPTISITSPTNGSMFAAPWTGTIQVSDSDSDGTVSKIQFFAGTTLLGTLNSPVANANLTVTNLAAGSYTLTAVATDNGGASTTSAGIHISVQTPTNIPPTISITSPTNGSMFAAPWTGTIQVSDSDTDGTVSKIQFFAGTTLLGTLNSPAANASLTVTNLAAGSYTLTAVAMDNGGASTTSPGVNISVVAQAPFMLSSVQRPSTNSFQFTYSTTPGLHYIVKRSTNLSIWNPLATNAATGSSATFTDNAATGTVNFYRVERNP
jgi:plastocyanin/uncharacterized protein (DUF2141 family)